MLFRYQGFNIGETTPPPDIYSNDKDDGFPKVFNMTSNTFTKGGLACDEAKKLEAEQQQKLKEQQQQQQQQQDESVESEPPKRETKKQRKAKLAKTSETKTEKTTETIITEPAKQTESEKVKNPEPKTHEKVESEPVLSTKSDEVEQHMETEPAYPGEDHREVKPESGNNMKPEIVNDSTAEMEAEEIKTSKEKPVKQVYTSRSVPVEVVESKPAQPSLVIPVEIVEPELIKPVEIVQKVPGPVEQIDLEPAKVLKTETVQLDSPVVAEEVKPDREEQQVNEMSEAELNKKDIGKVAEKLTSKAKIKKIKSKKAVLRKTSVSESSFEDQQILEDEKENMSNGLDDSSLGSKARKRPLEDATADWTTEGQPNVLLRCCLTILLAFIIAGLAYFLIH